MAEMKNDSKPIKVEPPKISRNRPSTPNANNILDNLLENVGLQNSDGGTA